MSRHRPRRLLVVTALVFVIGVAVWMIAGTPASAEAAAHPADRAAVTTGGLRAPTDVVPVRLRAPLAWTATAEAHRHGDGGCPRHLPCVPASARHPRVPLYALLGVFRL